MFNIVNVCNKKLVNIHLIKIDRLGSSQWEKSSFDTKAKNTMSQAIIV